MFEPKITRVETIISNSQCVVLSVALVYDFSLAKYTNATGIWFQVPEISVSDIQPSQLTNCGLLIAAFKDDDGDIMDLKMVVQVSEQRGSLQRIIFNPLE